MSTKKIFIEKVPFVRKSRYPRQINAELATLVTTVPLGDQWLHEIKWDGYRLIARIKNDHVKLLTRRHNDWTHHFPAVKEALTDMQFANVIFDGEIVALNEELSADFQILQNSLEKYTISDRMVYYIFDILFYDGHSLVNTPLLERKKFLRKLLATKKAVAEIKFNDHIIGNGEQVFRNACKLKLEGIISKRINSLYLQKRTKDWLKVKCLNLQEFVVGGFTDPRFSRQHFGALLLGYYNERQELIYCGKVGTGFTHASLQELALKLHKHVQPHCPFNNYPKKNTRGVHWLKPKLVAEISFLEFTEDGTLRHPSFKGLRKDKKAQDVKLELPTQTHKILNRMSSIKKIIT